MGIADWPDLLVTFAALERILAKAGKLPRPRRRSDGARRADAVARRPR